MKGKSINNLFIIMVTSVFLLLSVSLSQAQVKPGDEMRKKVIENFYKTWDFNKQNKAQKATLWETMDKYYNEDAVFQFASNPPVKVPATIKEAIKKIIEPWGEMEHILHRFVIRGDWAVVELTLKIVNRNGKKIDVPFAVVFEIKNNQRITYHHIYGDPTSLAD